MKSYHFKQQIRLFIMPVAVFLLLFTVTIGSMEALQKKAAIYDPGLDVKNAIKTAIDKAGKEQKHIILMFGGNWCSWCHKLHGLFKSNNVIKDFLAENYLLIMVDIGEKANEPLNRDLVDLYRVKNLGYPCITVLNSKGKFLCCQSTGVLEKDKKHDPKRVLAFLTAQAPHKK